MSRVWAPALLHPLAFDPLPNECQPERRMLHSTSSRERTCMLKSLLHELEYELAAILFLATSWSSCMVQMSKLVWDTCFVVTLPNRAWCNLPVVPDSLASATFAEQAWNRIGLLFVVVSPSIPRFRRCHIGNGLLNAKRKYIFCYVWRTGVIQC